MPRYFPLLILKVVSFFKIIVSIAYFEGRAWNVLVSKFDGNVVVSLFGGDVVDGAGSVLVVLALNNGLVGPFHGQAEAAGAGVAGLDDKLVVLVDDAPLQAIAVGLDLLRIAAALDRHRVGRVGQRLAVVPQVNVVVANPERRVADLCVVVEEKILY